MSVEKTLYGKIGEKDVNEFSITNNNGTKACILEYGATLDKFIINSKDGSPVDVLVSLPDLDSHIEKSDNQGVTVGRYANRICDGKFTIDGVEYDVKKNEKGITCLHGGDEFSKAVWSGEIISENSVSFSYESADMTNGFPGNIRVSVTFTLTDDNELKMNYCAVSDKKTVINLTNHAYFNLDGKESSAVLGHSLKINADRFTPIDERSIPTGEISSVYGTPFDFRSGKTIGKEIDSNDIQIKNGSGYDHNFCISGFDGTKRIAAVAKGEKSGITLTVKTDLPGVQLYTGNFLDGTVTGKYGKNMEHRSAFCLETQVYPDSPNHPEWTDCRCIYGAGEKYETETVYALSVD